MGKKVMITDTILRDAHQSQAATRIVGGADREALSVALAILMGSAGEAALRPIRAIATGAPLTKRGETVADLHRIERVFPAAPLAQHAVGDRNPLLDLEHPHLPSAPRLRFRLCGWCVGERCGMNTAVSSDNAV